ncbi:MAG: F-type H+/Na+-transporting ATPase subunit alpha [Patescibacteria group bacterium]|nr:F-type H+/Na+-transporting ATPase subunit alpha [Patescibacteria group bacterium]
MSIQKIQNEIEKMIDGLSLNVEIKESGTVAKVYDGIATVLGLKDVASMEMLDFESGAKGIAFNLETDSVGAVIIDGADKVMEGEKVTRTKKILSVPVDDTVLGRVVDPLMKVLDGGEPINSNHYEEIEKIAPGVMAREPVNVPMQTGLKAVDALVPVGRGQRELIIGDRQTGKTTIAIDTIVNQKDNDVICVYVAIGQKESKIAQIVEELKSKDAMKYTIVVLAGVSQGATKSYLAPYTGSAIAEYFMKQGKDVLVVYDDLTKHAIAYREMSLLLKRPSGREAYPGDVFYLHSRLLERACRLNKENGGGSITALPIIETQAGDISGFIPTNVISITDGQIFTDSGLFYKGIRPAVDVGLSVSRVGGAAQSKTMKKNAGSMKLSLAQFRELESFSQFDSDLDPATKATLERGKRTVEILKQKNNSPMPVANQVASIYAVNNGLLDDIEVKDIVQWEKDFQEDINKYHKEFLNKLNSTWDENIEKELLDIITTFNREYRK